MHRVLSASHDTYITDKIIRGTGFRATDANVGQSGTLDLFKLYGEAPGSPSDAIELTRALVKFNMHPLRTMVREGDVDLNNIKAELVLSDIYGGQTTPSNFKLISFPLAQKFQEGIGRDVVNYNDLGTSNFLTASYTNGIFNLWNIPGGMKSGSLGDNNIDIIVSGSLQGPNGTQTLNLSSEQMFNTGEENLILDVTNAVSGVISNQIDDHGFLIAFSGSYEKDAKTYFVKRFASKNSSREDLRPKIVVKYDDSINDNHENFIFDVSGSVFLNNYHRGTLANIISGTSATEITGHNCLKLKLIFGSYSQFVTASQYSVGSVFKTGIYSASFAVSRYDNNFFNYLKNTTSASLDAIWCSGTDNFPDNNSSVAYLSSSLQIKTPFRTSFDGSQKRLLVRMKNLRPHYRKEDKVKLRVFIEDRDRQIVFKKRPLVTRSQVFENMHFQVRDSQSKRIMIPFDVVNNSTKLSSDSDGMFFNFFMDSLPSGRNYNFEFLIRDFSEDYYVKDVSAKFNIEVD